MKKRVSSLLLAVMLLVQLLPAPSAFADELTCTHHTHDAACGWAEAVQGVACSHTHDEAACYTVAAKCAHTCDENCTIEEGKCTTHTCDEACVEKVENCVHFTTHDDTCGYVAAKEASACSYDASTCEQCKAAEESAAQTTFAQMIAALPAPETIDPQDESQLETVRGQIAAVVAFALENGLYTSQDEVTSQSTIADLLDAMYPKEQLDTTDVAYIGENGYATLEAAIAAVQDGETITLTAGTHKWNAGWKIQNKAVTFNGGQDAILDLISVNTDQNTTGATLTFDNVTLKFTDDITSDQDNSTYNYKGFAHTTKVVYNNCTIYGKQFLYAPTVEFNNCVLNNKGDYSVWTYGSHNVTFTGCTFNSGGKAILIYNEKTNISFVANVTMTNCTFNDDKTLDTVKAAVETGSNANPVNGETANKYNLTFSGCTVNGFDQNKSDSAFWGNKNDMDYKHLKVVIDGKVTNAPKVTVTIGNSSSETTDTAEKIVEAAESAAATSGSTVELTAGTNEVSTELISAVAGSEADIAVVIPSAGSNPIAEVKLDVAAAAAVSTAAAGTDSVTLNVVPAEENDKPANAPDGATVYNITLKADETEITSFGDGKVTVTLPAPTPATGESYEDMRVYYYGNGVKTDMNAAISAAGAVFTTDHFSLYSIEGVDDTAWYGDGTATKFTIKTAAELADFAKRVNEGNNFADKTVKLGADIDLENKEWTQIGNASGKTFCGTFDGGNHTISNLYINGTDNYVGLFGRLGPANSEGTPAVIQNLTIHNANVSGNYGAGAIAGNAYPGKFINCYVTGNITITASAWYAGGIVGYGYIATAENCHVSGNIKISSTNNGGVGGINGWGYFNATNCSVTGAEGSNSTITGASSYVGGIVGWCGEGNNAIKNCSVKNVSISGADTTGGITGLAHYGNTVSGSTVESATVKATDSNCTSVGLIAGANNGTASSPTKVINNTVDTTKALAGNTEITTHTGSTKSDDSAIGGTIVGTGVTFDDSGKITGGTFEVAPPASSVADNYIPVENADGTFGVKPTADDDGKVLYYVEHYIADKSETTGYKLHEREFQYGTVNAAVSYEPYVKEAIQVGTVKYLFNEDKDEAHTGTIANGEETVVLKLYYDVAQTAYNPENVRYIVEHYKNVDGKYTLVKADTEMPNGTIGDTVKAVAKNYEGYRVNEEASVLTGKLVKLEKDTDIVTLKVCYDVDYKVIKGAGQTVHQGEKASFTANIDYEKFTGVLIDGKKLSERHYEHRSGSTVVILKPSYTESLKARHTYTLTIQAIDGEAETTFRVKSAPVHEKPEKDYDSDSPKTGDTTNQGLWLAIAALGITGMLASIFGKKYLIKRK